MRSLKQPFFKTFFILTALALCLGSAYLFAGLAEGSWNYNIARRINILAAIAVTAVSVGLSSVVFQTITSNHILTPSIMGLDNLYVFIQTVVIYFLGTGEMEMMTRQNDFLLTLAIMTAASTSIFIFMFKTNCANVYFAVLAGLVFGIAFGGLSSFMQVIIDPSEFSILEGRMFASFNKINLPLMGISSLIVALSSVWIALDFKNLDVMTLGRAHSVALGVNYEKIVLKTFVAVSLLTSASTVLVGPVTFLGILIVSIARFIFPTYRHDILVPGTILVGICALISGMLVTERYLQFTVPLSVIINFAGGICFIYLVLKLKRI